MKKYLNFVIAILEMFVGNALTAAAVGMISLPQGFAVGGVTGLSKVLAGFVPIPISVIVFVLNMCLLVIAYVFVGKELALRTVALSILFPVMLGVFEKYPLTSIADDHILSIIVAGTLLGVGAGLILRSGASSGGYDILGIIINKKTGIAIATVINICDASVIVMQAIGQPLKQTLYGILVITVCTAVLNRVVTMGRGESRIMIFSEKHEELRNAILDKMDVGLTFLNAETGYEKNEMKVIVTIAPHAKILPLKKLVTSIDPLAFVAIDDVYSVLGKGYTVDRYSTPVATKK